MKTINIKYILLWVILIPSFFSVRAEENDTPTIDYLYYYEYGYNRDAFIYVDTHNKDIKSMSMQYYLNTMALTNLTSVDLTPLLSQLHGNKGIIKVPEFITRPSRISITFADGTTYNSNYFDILAPYTYISDWVKSQYSISSNSAVNMTSAKGDLNLNGQKYAKGFWIHAVGYLTVPITPGVYSRFVAHSGKQQGQPYKLETVLSISDTEVARSGVIASTTRAEWDFSISKTDNEITVDILLGDGSNANDHGVIGAPRLYYTQPAKTPQTIEWRSSYDIKTTKPLVYNLDAKASSGLDNYYMITYGEEYAEILDGNKLNIHTIPTRDSIVVEVINPGDMTFAPAEPKSATFNLVKGISVNSDESIEISGNQTLEELVINADGNSCGQVNIKSGIVTVNNLVLKYSVKPGNWYYISFPSEVDINKVSNLSELEFSLNGVDGKGAYTLQEYNTKQRSESQNGWNDAESSIVTPQKGYLLRLDDYNGEANQEITFTINNVNLDFESTIKIVDLTLDMSQAQANDKKIVYITPENAKGNTLKVEVTYNPESSDNLPLNYQVELDNARVTYAPKNSGIRLTLPDSSPAKVYILDKKKKHVIEAIHYKSPMLIDTSNLKSGEYNLYIEYGGATALKSFVKQ